MTQEAVHTAVCLTGRQCFSCGGSAASLDFSARQLARLNAGEIARCVPCIAAGITARYELPPPPPSLSEQLEEAVAGVDEVRVAALLLQGADANHVRQRGVSLGGRWRGLFSPNGAPLPEEDAGDAQPTTPLKLVGFRVADGALLEGDLGRLARVARLLLQHGALAAPALRHMELRYGAFCPQASHGGFGEVYALVHAAAAAQARLPAD